MNAQRKKSAITKYQPIFESGTTPDELRELLTQDEKKYPLEEVEEILFAITNPAPPAGSNPPPPPPPPPPPAGSKQGEENEAPVVLNKKYEEWSVEPVYEPITDATGKQIGRKLVKYDKLKKIRTTTITSDKAEILNQQSENTKLRLFEVE